MAHLFSHKTLISVFLISPIVLIPSLLHVQPVQAASCVSRACIDVYTQDGQIIIEGRKGGVTEPKPTLAPKPTAKPIPGPTFKPKAAVAIKPSNSARVKSVPRKKVVRKVLPKVASRVSLNDRLVKLLPPGLIARQPAANAIVNVPVIYWCDLPEVFMTKVVIIGEAVDVTMRPSFLWSFGDGSFLATTSAGAPFPHQKISHTYSKAGTYVVTLLATWGGTWTHNGVARAITGKVRKVSIATVSIANGPTRLTQ